MMFSNLAFKNIRRSIKDYSIYFLTLVFGICIFYIFNSIEAQGIMMELSKSMAKAFSMATTVMGVTSVFVSFILGFLIVYANNYIIKRRNKEFGIYMTLGMEKSSLTIIIFIETLLIGIISLIVGIILGVFLSQGMSALTAKLFKVDLTNFKFIFSVEAAVKTVIYFSIIYLIVLIFNSVSINKIRLINLLNLARKNENIKIRKLWLSVIIFFISISMIALSYYIIFHNGISIFDTNLFIIPVVMGGIGTVLFFFSLAGFLLKVIKSSKNIYLKNLNMFILRQINSKINTVFISMSFISLMLFISICTLTGGFGISSALNNDLEELTQYDAMLYFMDSFDVEKYFEENNINLNTISEKYVIYDYYRTNINYSDILNEEYIEKLSDIYMIKNDEYIEAMKLSDYNKLLKMRGMEEISLNSDEYLIFADHDEVIDALNKSLKENNDIIFNGKTLRAKNSRVYKFVSYIDETKNNIGKLVINDELVESLEKVSTYANINYKNPDLSIYDIFEEKEGAVTIADSYLLIRTKEEVLAEALGTGAIVSYLGIYLGGIFLITSAAVLALQQLSEANDNKERYSLLKKIGTDESMINKALFLQIFIYFMMPLSLALIHSIPGLYLSKEIISMFGNIKIMSNIFISLVILILIYGGYFIATYFGTKKNISQI
ncbi:ABC transporter permease [Clostridium isatidis]|uniref:ABC transporter permease n=1 Tax=Clostridium isatidis TaxID=182773 RepID=UPI003AAAC478